MSINTTVQDNSIKQHLLSKRTITFMGLMIFMMSIGEGVVTPAIPLHGDALGASYRQLGFFMTGYSVAYTLMAVTAGTISDLLSRKTILLLSIGLTIIAALGYYFAATPFALLFFRTLEGASRGMLWQIAEAIVADNTNSEARSRVMGRFTAAYGLGAVIGTFSSGYIMQYFSINAVFPIYPIIGVIVVVASLYGITEKKVNNSSQHGFLGISSGISIGCEIKKIWPVCLSGFAYAGFLYSIWGMLPKIADHVGALPQQIGFLFALFWGTRLVSFLVCGESAMVIGRKKMLLIGISFIVLSTVIFFNASAYLHLLAAAAAGGIGTGIMFTISITLIADLINPACLGFGMGFLEFSMGLGMIIQNTLSGIIGEWLGINYTYLFVFIVALAAFFAVSLFLQTGRSCNHK